MSNNSKVGNLTPQGQLQSLTIDDDVYTGEGRGSHPKKKYLAHNLDFSGFSVVLREVYNLCASENTNLESECPFPVYQHAMVEFLNAYILHYAKFVLRAPDLQNLKDPLSAIGAKNYYIPKPIYDYITGIGVALTKDERVYANIPAAAIPQGPILGIVSSGTFGPPTATNHNVYECYFSPFITSSYIKQSALNSDNTKWNPFPATWISAKTVLNENLLGYRPTKVLNIEAIKLCNYLKFDNSSDITGRLCHSDVAISFTCNALLNIKGIKTVKAVFKPQNNSTVFIFKENTDSITDLQSVLWKQPSNLNSPYPFGMSASNRANYFAYKRKRNIEKPGIFFTIDDELPEGWIDTINNNFEMKAPFVPMPCFFDRASLREDNHVEGSYNGNPLIDVSNWLRTCFYAETNNE